MRYTLLLLVSVFFFQLSAWTKGVYFKHLHSIGGFSSQSAISIWQDQFGNIWFGNDMLNKYNGNTIKTYRLSDYLDDIKDINIRQICGDRVTMIYILADDEVVMYDTCYDKFIKTGIKADCIFSSDGGILHYTQSNCLYSYNYKTNVTEKILEVKNPVNIISMIFSDNNQIWLGTNAGLLVVNNKNIEYVIADINVSCLFEDSQQNIWVGTVNDGVRIVKKGTNEILVFKEESSLPLGAKILSNRIRCFNEDDKQNIWIGTYKGITMFSLDTEKTIAIEHNESAFYSLRHNSIYSIYKDQQGTMWVGSYYGGVSYYNPGMELYNFYATSSVDKSMLSGLIIGDITEDNKGNLYIATEEGGINIFNPHTGSIKRYDKSNSNLPHNTIKSIWYDKKYKRFYVGTFTEGLWYMNEGSDRFAKAGSAILSTYNQKIIGQILPYNEEYIIISTQDGVYKVDRKTLDLTTLINTPALDYENIGIIRTMFIDSDEMLWVSASDKGLFNLNLKTFETQHFSGKEIDVNLDKSIIKCIQQGTDGKIYLMSRSHLWAYDKVTRLFTLLNDEDNFSLSGTCCNMAYSPSGRFIITTDTGITIINPISLNPIHLPFAEIFPFKAINASCGLYISSDNEHIYMGVVGGLLILKEKDIETMSNANKYSHRLSFSSLSVNNRQVNPQSAPDILPVDISYAKSIKLNYKQNNISLTFASSDFMHNTSVLYEYILENFDRQWTITNDKVIRYTSLPPGNYSLIIREVNNRDNRIKLNVNITPPFYASAGAYIIYFVLLISLLIYIIRIVQKNVLLKASLRMEHIEKVHLAELDQMRFNFFTNVSHEFRTPLTLITNQIDITLNNTNLTQSLRNRFLKIRNQAKEMQLLIDELMYFNKLEQSTSPLKVSKQDMTSFINEIYISFKEYAQVRRITFTYEHANEPIDVWMDRIQMQKVISNLLSNAFKFTKDGGAITMALKRKRDCVEIAVRDDGIGIRKEDLDKIFERFYQADYEVSTPRMKGMGVGLALSKNIVNQHHGDISVESTMGEGTCFRVRLLPGDNHFLDEQKEEQFFIETEYLTKVQLESITGEVIDEKEDENTIAYDKYSKANILIIENNEELLQLLTEVFSPVYHVITAEDGETGLSKALKMNPDIVLTDVMIPCISGLDICKKLKSRTDTSHIPVVLITARSSLKQNMEGLQCGADDYIVKPFNIELLLLKCNNLVKNRKELYVKYQNTITNNLKANPATNSINQRFVENAITIIESNLTNTDFDVSAWAKELSIGRSKLFQKIKDITGYTPNEYIIIIKMQKATALLKENPNLTIAEIAYRTGFSSPGYFSKSFKEYYGVTPLQYRQS